MSSRSDEIDRALLSDSHLNIHERANLVISKRVKPRHSFNLTKSYRTFLNRYCTNTTFGISIAPYREEIDEMVKELDDIVNQSIAKAHEYKILKVGQELKPENEPWIEYIPNEKGHYPTKYEQFLVQTSMGTFRLLNWGKNKWGIDDSRIDFYRKIHKA